MAAPAAAATPGTPGSNAWKWWLTIVLFVATILTYLDRQTMSLCGPMICQEFKLSNEQYGQLVAAFRWAYALSHVPAGFMADHLPIRMTYALAIGLWSAAGAAAAWVFRFRSLLMTRRRWGWARLLTGLAPHASSPTCFRPTTAGWPAECFNSGAALGSLAGPLDYHAPGDPFRLAGGVPRDLALRGSVGSPSGCWRRGATAPATPAITMDHEYSRTRSRRVRRGLRVSRRRRPWSPFDTAAGHGNRSGDCWQASRMSPRHWQPGSLAAPGSSSPR